MNSIMCCGFQFLSIKIEKLSICIFDHNTIQYNTTLTQIKMSENDGQSQTSSVLDSDLVAKKFKLQASVLKSKQNQKNLKLVFVLTTLVSLLLLITTLFLYMIYYHFVETFVFLAFIYVVRKIDEHFPFIKNCWGRICGSLCKFM